MSLSKAWSSKEIIKFFKSNRSTFNSLYKGEKYLLSKYVQQLLLFSVLFSILSYYKKKL